MARRVAGDNAISCVEPGMSIVAVVASVAASTKCTLWAVLAVTMRFGPPGRLLGSIMRCSIPRSLRGLSIILAK